MRYCLHKRMAPDSKSETRRRGFLTKDDRKYLLGEKTEELDGSARRQKHLKIRQRTENAIRDFKIIEQYLPDKDIEQIFEPAYQWGRKRRDLNEQGKYSTQPDTPELVYNLLSFMNFFGYSMVLSRLSEVNGLRKMIIEQGLERGLRKYNLRHGKDYLEYNVTVNVEISERKAMQNHLIEVDRKIPEEPDKAAQEILDLHGQYKIPNQFAQKLWEDYVENEERD